MATEVPLIPCINRQSLQILDVSDSGLIAYGSRCSICIINFNTSLIPVIVDSKFIPNAHRGKVTALSFCKVNDKFIASFGDDSFVKVWDLETQTCTASLELKENIRTVEWLHGSATNVTFPGNFSFIRKWNYTTNNVKYIKTGSESIISVLSSNKVSPELLAAGHVVGTISIMNVDTETILCKLKSHLVEITNLNWSTVSPTMLLSTSLDHTARVWKIGDSQPVRIFNYPKSRKLEDKKHPLRICGVFHPENPDVIICSNVGGYIGEVTFEDDKSPKFVSYVEKNNDNAFLNKSINIMMPYLKENKIVLLTSDHVKMSLWDVSEKKLLTPIYYLMGIIYDLAASTINPYNLAIGTSDGCLRIWNMNETTKLDMTTIYVNFRIKIMTIAWHPTDETLIAYGTDEGRIGIADIHKKKTIYSFETHHTNAVYVLQWAPCSKIKESDAAFFLYSCSNSTIFIYELHKPKEKPLDFDELITYPPDLEFVLKTHCELSWNSDYTRLIVGSYKGFLDIFDNKFNFLTRVTMQVKMVESVKWHPRYTFTSSKGSDYSSWFAAAGSDSDIPIFDTSDIQKENSESVVCRPTKILVGHKKRISSLCWSPHRDGYLASASRDGTVLVWNVLTSTIIANYPCHQELVYAVHWSYFDPDIIYSGGYDSSLRVWKISEQIQSAPEKCQIIKRKTKPIKVQENNSRIYGRNRKFFEKDEDFRERCDSRNGIDEIPKASNILETEDVSNKEDFSKKKLEPRFEKGETYQKFKSRKLFSGFYNTGSKDKEEKLEHILKLTDLLSQSQDSSDPENITLISDMLTEKELLDCGLYCDQLTAMKMLEVKSQVEEDSGCFDNTIRLQLMANNVESLLIRAAEKKRLSDFLMAAAATVSRKFYNEMCKKYAVQLIEEKQYVKAGFYLMFCGELHNAVKTMLDKAKFLEALALAKAQLPPDDPFIRGILLKTANHFSIHNEYESEAECYLALNEPSEAAKVLYRIGDSSSMYACAYICKKFNLIEEAETYGYLCMEKCLAECAWPIFYKIIDVIDSLKVYKLLGCVHELVSTQIKTLKKDDIPSDGLFGITGNKLQIWKSKMFGDSHVPFVPFIYDVLKSENILPEDKNDFEEIRSALDSLVTKRQKYEISTEAHINLAIYTSQVIISSLLNDSNVVEKYLLKVFPSVYNIAFMPRVVFWLFLPFDIYWCSNKDAFICENKYLESQSFLHIQSIYKSLCDKFVSLNTSVVENFSISQTFSSNLDEAVKQVLNILSTKTLKDSVILYFSICYIAEMRRVAKHGWKFRCYNSVTKKTEKVESEDCDLSVESDEKNTVCIEDKNIEELRVELDVNCSDSAGQNNLPIILPAKNIDTCLSSLNKNTNCTPPVIENNNSTVPNSFLMHVDDIVEEKESKTTSSISGECQSFVEPVCNDNDAGTVNGVFENVNKEIENEILLTKKIEDEISSPKAVSEESSEVEENALLHNSNGVIEENTYLHGNNNVEENALSYSTNSEDREIIFLHSNNDEVRQNALSQNNSEVEEKDALLETATVEKEKRSSLECTYSTVQVEGIYSEAEDDHLQCWCDVSFFYTLIKSFTSVSCRDEYALLFYLQKYLSYLDNAVANLARQKSIKSALNDHKEVLDVMKDDSHLNQKNNCTDLINIERDPQDNFIASSMENGGASHSPKENGVSYSNDDGLLMQEKETKNGEASYSPRENGVSYSDDGCFMQEKETKNVKNEVSYSPKENGTSYNKDDIIQETETKNESYENVANSDETNIKLSNSVIKDGTNSLHEKDMVTENLQLEHEKISQLMELFNSVEFDYPNPFDAVSLINGLCCDIVRKNPCNFVKKKFHDFAHEVNKWNVKFCVKDETVKCDICKEVINI